MRAPLGKPGEFPTPIWDAPRFLPAVTMLLFGVGMALASPGGRDGIMWVQIDQVPCLVKIPIPNMPGITEGYLRGFQVEGSLLVPLVEPRKWDPSGLGEASYEIHLEVWPTHPLHWIFLWTGSDGKSPAGRTEVFLFGADRLAGWREAFAQGPVGFRRIDNASPDLGEWFDAEFLHLRWVDLDGEQGNGLPHLPVLEMGTDLWSIAWDGQTVGKFSCSRLRKDARERWALLDQLADCLNRNQSHHEP